MNDNPLISVNMAAYNAEKYIAEAIQSVIDQTYQNWELIIINDCSTDNTSKEISKFNDPRIKIFHNDQNEGIVYTRNRALHYSKGKYIAVLDSDDIFLPEKLAIQVDFMEQHEEYGLIGTGLITIDLNGKEINKICMNAPVEFFPFILLFNNFILHSSILMCRNLAIEILYKPLVRGFSPGEDPQLYAAIARTHKIWNLPDILTKYRIHNASISKVREDMIKHYADKVILDQLKLLGLHCNANELSLHKKSFSEEKVKSYQELSKISKWLTKLKYANIEYKIYNNKDFENFLAEKWIKTMINNADFGLNILKQCVFSSFFYSNFIEWNLKKHLIKVTLIPGSKP